MTRKEFIESAEQLKEMLLEKLEADEITDYAKEHINVCIEEIIELAKENYE